MQRERKTTKILAMLAALALLMLAAGAQADDLEGAGVVLERSMATRSLLLDGNIVLHVDDKTLITNEFGQKITLADVPAATKDPTREVYSVLGNETIEWEARMKRDKKIATQIRVLGFPLD